jgi:hypothetical protein
MATMRRLTMSFMPNVASIKAEATNPIAPLSVTIALCVTAALCATIAGTIMPPQQREISGPKMNGGALPSPCLQIKAANPF